MWSDVKTYREGWKKDMGKEDRRGMSEGRRKEKQCTNLELFI